MISTSNSCFSCHSMLLKENGDLFTYGYNGYGSCGVGHQKDVSTPTLVMNNPRIKSIELGVWNSFYLESSGDLFACGYNYKGELGLGTCENKSTFTFVTNEVKKVCASRYFTLIQKYNGKVYYSGELVDGTKRSFEEIEIDDVVDFSCGEYHCLFLKKNGEVYGMGLSRYGELLTKELKEFKTPTFILKDENIVSVKCSLYQNFILTRNGSGTYLKLFGKDNEFYGGDARRGTILEIHGHPDIKSIHCGSNHCFLLKENGSVFAAGINNDGQLSLGNNSCFHKFTQTNLTNITHIVPGYYNTTFINEDNQIFNCGNAASGRLGSSKEGNRNIAEQLEFDDLILINNHQFVDEWSTDVHKSLPNKFKKTVLTFLLCLKKRDGPKVPRPLVHIFIKYYYHLVFSR